MSVCDKAVFPLQLSNSQWLMPINLISQEVKIRRIMVQSQPGQIVHETLSWKILSQKRAGRAAQDEALSSNPSRVSPTPKKKRGRKEENTQSKREFKCPWWAGKSKANSWRASDPSILPEPHEAGPGNNSVTWQNSPPPGAFFYVSWGLSLGGCLAPFHQS
jgi:hypothetical protein